MMPSAMTMANKLITLMLPPHRYSAMKAAMMATGIPTATQMATRPFNSTYNASTTNAKPANALSTIKPMRPST